MASNTHILRILFVTIALTAGLSAMASRAIVSFSVTGFDTSAPEEEVIGSMEVELSDSTKEVVAVVTISLSINGHVFEISELGFSEYRNFNIVGAQGDGLGSLTGISHGSPYDFWILWNKESSLPKEFAYTGEFEGIHSSKDFSSFSIEEVE
ncbi:MAG: hypothetical protein ACI92G_001199 [Candidatus Pelagisphaera sp.]|jgi:hypothetical protein